MKLKLFQILSTGAWLMAHQSSAADLTWDLAPGAVGAGDSAITGGTGIWDLAAGNWTTDAGATNVAWDNTLNAGDTAVFSTTNGTVTVNQETLLKGLRFASGATNYSIAGTGSLNFGAVLGSINSSVHGGNTAVTNTISAPLAGTAGLTIAANGNLSASGGSSTGALNLSGANTSLTGGITITSGLVNFTSSSAAGSAATTAGSGNALTLNGGGLVASGANVTLGNHTSIGESGGTLRAWGSRTLTLNGVLSGSGTLNKTDSGIVLVNNTANTFSGTLNVQSGTFRIGSTTGNATYAFGAKAINVSAGNILSLASASGSTITVTYNFAGLTAPISINGGTLNYTQTNNTTQNLSAAVQFSGNSTISLNASSFSVHTAALNGAITGTSGSLTFTAAGGSARNFALGSNSNNYTGGVLLGAADSGSTFNLNNLLGIADWTVNDADWTVNVSNVTHTFKSLSSSVNPIFTATGASARLSVGSGSTDTVYAGRISGTLGLTKEGTGKLTLSNNLNYAGSTEITGGTLVVNGAHTGAGNFTVGSNGTLSGTGSIATAISVEGTLAPGGTIGKLLLDGTVTFQPGSAYAWQIADWEGVGEGVDWDSFNAGDLVFAATPTTKLTIRVAGSPLNFFESAKTFVIANSANNITGFDPSAIQVDASGFVGQGTWSVQVNGSSVELVYAPASLNPFQSWASSYSTAANPSADPDGDGISNGIEFVIGGNPIPGAGANSLDLLPTTTRDASYLNFTYRRTSAAASMPLAQQPYVQYGSDLSNWAKAVNGSNGVIISVTPGTPDLVTVKIPLGLASSGKLFARLKVDIASN